MELYQSWIYVLMQNMQSNTRFFLKYHLLFLLFFLSAISLSLYLLNPFGNECVKGDCKNGYGSYRYGSGMQYEGEWKKGKRHGQGTLQYPDGTKYTGGWINDRMHGQGTKIYASDRLYKQYIGEWKSGNKHGKGTAIYSHGLKHVGYWKDGQKKGHGIYTTSQGYKVEGEWNGEIRHGEVTETFPDGKIIIVGRKDNRRHGRGVLIYPDGTKITGEWIKDKMVGSLEFYLFHFFEFKKVYSINALCNAIKKNILFSPTAKENTIQWLNALLKSPDLYEKLSKQIHNKNLTTEIDILLESTRNYRNKKFAELNLDKQKDILKLNRLLIEHLYRGLTPKS